MSLAKACLLYQMLSIWTSLEIMLFGDGLICGGKVLKTSWQTEKCYQAALSPVLKLFYTL